MPDKDRYALKDIAETAIGEIVASDYPIALFMGYLIGKNIAKSRIETSDYRFKTAQKYQWNLSSSTAWDGTPLYGVTISIK